MATKTFFSLPRLKFLTGPGWELGPWVKQVRLSDWFMPSITLLAQNPVGWEALGCCL